MILLLLLIPIGFFEIILPHLFKKKIRIMEEKKDIINNIILEVQNFDEIITYSQNIHSLLQDIQFYRKLGKFSSGVTKFDIYNYYDGTLTWIIFSLSNLRSDLSIRLTEQQQTLESAKSEVEKNISGTTELNQVSEVQRARLDKQIEQFEELQRILIKT